jgi:prepilin-type processing-associated H-X9-DG protein
MADLFGVPAPAVLVPPLDKLMPELEPAGAISRVDDAGYHYRSVTPFPGAAVLGSQAQTMLGQQALLISILLPSLNRARETANRVKCASNERQIGQAIQLYANEHNGKYPPDLGTLIKTEDITADAFVCPSGNTSVPPGVTTQGADAIADWVNKHTDYIYIPGKTNAAPADDVVIYEKPGDHGHDGMNILYGDGHVEWQSMPGAIHELQRCHIPVPQEMLQRR